MPLIWNNKEYKLVKDDEEWNRLEYVIARKIYVEIEPDQVCDNFLLLLKLLLFFSNNELYIFRLSIPSH